MLSTELSPVGMEHWDRMGCLTRGVDYRGGYIDTYVYVGTYDAVEYCRGRAWV